ncbi:MAG TPA: hypothetical protein VJT49_18925 [Amycolatopsis sp.]|uniref:hypothetical protein n=1 Tax=Amycolatopsis sp. TaxID=37632 RepID=UPI002B487ECA|nr:hypothetical protein [Amycolatopsis sp.]HKS47140.1 hypothetical protein [Amycolatopsis sp.]
MSKLTVDEAKNTMRRCAGDDGGRAMDGDVTDIGFEEPGHASPAWLETAGDRDPGTSAMDHGRGGDSGDDDRMCDGSRRAADQAHPNRR